MGHPLTETSRLPRRAAGLQAQVGHFQPPRPHPAAGISMLRPQKKAQWVIPCPKACILSRSAPGRFGTLGRKRPRQLRPTRVSSAKPNCLRAPSLSLARDSIAVTIQLRGIAGITAVQGGNARSTGSSTVRVARTSRRCRSGWRLVRRHGHWPGGDNGRRRGRGGGRCGRQ